MTSEKDKRIINTVSVEYAIRAYKALKLNIEDEDLANKTVSVMTLKIKQWLLIKATNTGMSISAQAAINKALMFIEYEILKFETLEDILEKAEKLFNFFIEIE